jgi:hypothetical protein
MASAGDVNGDGFGDVILGGGSELGGTEPWPAYVFHGSASGLITTPAATLVPLGDEQGVSGAGDVNGDGYADVMVAVETETFAGLPYGGSAQDMVFVFLGGSGGVSTDPATKLIGRAATDLSESEFGMFGITAADVNGDGYWDVGVCDDSANYGLAVFLGAPTGVSTTRVATLGTGVYAGNYPSACGDINGDGIEDVGGGAFSIFYGASGGPHSDPSITLTDPQGGNAWTRSSHESTNGS